VNIILNRL